MKAIKIHAVKPHYDNNELVCYVLDDKKPYSDAFYIYKDLKLSERISFLSSCPKKQRVKSLREAIDRIKSFAKKEGIRLRKYSSDYCEIGFKVQFQ